jgi:hypothetical protein
MPLDHSLRRGRRGVQHGRTDGQDSDECGSDADERYPTSGWLMQCHSKVTGFPTRA